MTIRIPSELPGFVVTLGAGQNFPATDEDGQGRNELRHLARADELDATAARLSVALRRLSDTSAGVTAEAAVTQGQQHVAWLADLAKCHRSLAAQCKDSRIGTKETKITVIGALVLFAAQFAYALATIALAPAAVAAVAASEARTRGVIEVVTRTLLLRVASRGAAEQAARRSWLPWVTQGLWGLGQGGGVNFIAQKNSGADHVNWRMFAAAAAAGVVGAEVGYGIGRKAMGAAGRLDMYAVRRFPPGTIAARVTRVGAGVVAMAGSAAMAGAGGGIAGGVSSGLIVGELDWGVVLHGATIGAGAAVLGSSAHTVQHIVRSAHVSTPAVSMPQPVQLTELGAGAPHVGTHLPRVDFAADARVTVAADAAAILAGPRPETTATAAEPALTSLPAAVAAVEQRYVAALKSTEAEYATTTALVHDRHTEAVREALTRRDEAVRAAGQEHAAAVQAARQDPSAVERVLVAREQHTAALRAATAEYHAVMRTIDVDRAGGLQAAHADYLAEMNASPPRYEAELAAVQIEHARVASDERLAAAEVVGQEYRAVAETAYALEDPAARAAMLADAESAYLAALRPAADAALEFFQACRDAPGGSRWALLSDQQLGHLLIHGTGTEATAAAIEVNVRVEGKEMRPTQVQATMAMSHGAIPEVACGEGKTLAVKALEARMALKHGAALLVTSSEYLANREVGGYAELARFGVDAFRLDPNQPLPALVSGRYPLAIATDREVAFFQLNKHELVFRNAEHEVRLKFATIDEIDQVLSTIDNSARNKLYILADGTDAPAPTPLANVVNKIQHLLDTEVLTKTDFDFDANGSIHLSEAGHLRITEAFGRAPTEPETQRFTMAAEGHWNRRQDVDYLVDRPDAIGEVVDGRVVGEIMWHNEFVGDFANGRILADGKTFEATVTPRTGHEVMDGLKVVGTLVDDGWAIGHVEGHGKILIIDQTNHEVLVDPRMASENRWHGGLAQALEAKHGLPIRNDPDTVASRNAPEVFAEFTMTGTTGTGKGSQLALHQDYGLGPVVGIERFHPSLLKHEEVVSLNDEARLEAVAAHIVANHRSGEGPPQLILCHRNDLVAKLSELLERQGIKHEAMDGQWQVRKGDQYREAQQQIVERAGGRGAVTIGTMQLARGTDVVIDGSDPVVAQHGLQVAITGHSRIADVDVQAVSRAARSGQPGTATIFSTPGDDIFTLAANPNVTHAVIQYTNAVSEHRFNPTAATRAAVGHTAEQLHKLVPELQRAAAEERLRGPAPMHAPAQTLTQTPSNPADLLTSIQAGTNTLPATTPSTSTPLSATLPNPDQLAPTNPLALPPNSPSTTPVSLGDAPLSPTPWPTTHSTPAGIDSAQPTLIPATVPILEPTAASHGHTPDSVDKPFAIPDHPDSNGAATQHQPSLPASALAEPVSCLGLVAAKFATESGRLDVDAALLKTTDAMPFDTITDVTGGVPQPVNGGGRTLRGRLRRWALTLENQRAGRGHGLLVIAAIPARSGAAEPGHAVLLRTVVARADGTPPQVHIQVWDPLVGDRWVPWTPPADDGPWWAAFHRGPDADARPVLVVDGDYVDPMQAPTAPFSVARTEPDTDSPTHRPWWIRAARRVAALLTHDSAERAIRTADDEAPVRIDPLDPTGLPLDTHEVELLSHHDTSELNTLTLIGRVVRNALKSPEVVVHAGQRIPVGMALVRQPTKLRRLGRLMANEAGLHLNLVGLIAQVPRTAAKMIQHDWALSVCSDIANLIRRSGLDAAISDYQNGVARANYAIPLSARELEVSNETQVLARSNQPDGRPRQPDFDSTRKDDPSYLRAQRSQRVESWSRIKSEMDALCAPISQPGVSKYQPRTQPKSEESTHQKLADPAVANDLSLIHDIVCGRIVFNNLTDLYQAVGRILDEPDLRQRIVAFDDRIRNRRKSGYFDVRYLLRLDSGHIIELIFVLDKVVTAVETGQHALRELERAVINRAHADGRVVGYISGRRDGDPDLSTDRRSQLERAFIVGMLHHGAERFATPLWESMEPWRRAAVTQLAPTDSEVPEVVVGPRNPANGLPVDCGYFDDDEHVALTALRREWGPDATEKILLRGKYNDNVSLDTHRAWAVEAARARANYTHAELVALTRRFPFEFGNHAQAGAAWQDSALRLWLARRISELEQRRDHNNETQTVELLRLHTVRRGLASAERQADAMGQHITRPPVYLVSLDPTAFGGKGQAIIAFGDVDSAEKLICYVPALGGTDEQMPDKIENTLAVLEATRRVESELSVAGYTLLDYDAPSDDHLAWRLPNVRASARRLERFVVTTHALRQHHAEHGGAALPDIVVIGHSYGGVALCHTENRLAPYIRAVLVGVPHMGPLKTLAGLGLPPEKVLVLSSSEDLMTWMGRIYPEPLGALPYRGFLGRDPASEINAGAAIRGRAEITRDDSALPPWRDTSRLVHRNQLRFVDRSTRTMGEIHLSLGFFVADLPMYIPTERFRKNLDGLSYAARRALAGKADPAVARRRAHSPNHSGYRPPRTLTPIHHAPGQPVPRPWLPADPATSVNTIAHHIAAAATALAAVGISGPDVLNRHDFPNPKALRAHIDNVTRAWSTLTNPQRAWYGWAYPLQVGNSAIPRAEKDYFLRMYMVRQLNDFKTRVSGGPRQLHTLSEAEQRELRNLIALRTALGSAAAVPPGVTEPECFLENYAAGTDFGHGRMVFSLGHATPQIEVWLNPGIEISEQSLPMLMAHARNLYTTMSKLNPNQRVLIRVWSGSQSTSVPITDLSSRHLSAEFAASAGSRLRRDLEFAAAARSAQDPRARTRTVLIGYGRGGGSTGYAGAHGGLAYLVDAVGLLAVGWAGPITTAAEFGTRVFVAGSSRDAMTFAGGANKVQSLDPLTIQWAQGLDGNFDATRFAHEFPQTARFAGVAGPHLGTFEYANPDTHEPTESLLGAALIALGKYHLLTTVPFRPAPVTQQRDGGLRAQRLPLDPERNRPAAPQPILADLRYAALTQETPPHAEPGPVPGMPSIAAHLLDRAAPCVPGVVAIMRSITGNYLIRLRGWGHRGPRTARAMERALGGHFHPGGFGEGSVDGVLDWLDGKPGAAVATVLTRSGPVRMGEKASHALVFHNQDGQIWVYETHDPEQLGLATELADWRPPTDLGLVTGIAFTADGTPEHPRAHTAATRKQQRRDLNPTPFPGLAAGRWRRSDDEPPPTPWDRPTDEAPNATAGPVEPVPDDKANNASLRANRPLQRLLRNQVVTAIGNSVMSAALPLLTLITTGSVISAGWVSFAASVPAVLLPIPAGIVADRLNRRRVMIASQLIGLTATVAAGMVVLLGAPHLGVLLAALAFTERSASKFNDASSDLAVLELAGKELVHKAFKLNRLREESASAVGRLFGPILLAVGGSIPFAANAFGYAWGIVSMARLRHSFPASVSHDPAERTTVRRGLQAMWHNPFLRNITIVMTVSNAAFAALGLRVVAMVHDAAAPGWAAGMVLSAASVGGIVGPLVLGRLTDRIGIERLYPGMLVTLSGLAVAQALLLNPFLVAAAVFGVSVAGVAGTVGLEVYLARTVPDAVLGQALGIRRTLSMIGVALGGLGSGYLLAALGIGVGGWVAAAVVATASTVGLVQLYRVSRHERIAELQRNVDRANVALARAQLMQQLRENLHEHIREMLRQVGIDPTPPRPPIFGHVPPLFEREHQAWTQAVTRALNDPRNWPFRHRLLPDIIWWLERDTTLDELKQRYFAQASELPAPEPPSRPPVGRRGPEIAPRGPADGFPVFVVNYAHDEFGAMPAAEVLASLRVRLVPVSLPAQHADDAARELRIIADDHGATRFGILGQFENRGFIEDVAEELGDRLIRAAALGRRDPSADEFASWYEVLRDPNAHTTEEVPNVGVWFPTGPENSLRLETMVRWLAPGTVHPAEHVAVAAEQPETWLDRARQEQDMQQTLQVPVTALHPAGPPHQLKMLRHNLFVAYNEYGPRTGRTVVLIPDVPGSRVDPRPSDDELTALGIHLIVVDLPGTGYSVAPQGSHVNVQTVAHNILRALDGASAAQPISVIGRGLGGPVALAMAALMPERVDRVVMQGAPAAPNPRHGLDTEGMTPDNGSIFVRDVGREIQLRRQLYDTANKLHRDPVGYLQELFRRLPAGDQQILTDPALRAQLVHSLRESFRGDKAGLNDYIQVIKRSWNFALADIDVPVLIMHGAVDNQMPASHALRNLAEIPTAAMTILSDVGHFGMLAAATDALRWITGEDVGPQVPADGADLRPDHPEDVTAARHHLRQRLAGWPATFVADAELAAAALANNVLAHTSGAGRMDVVVTDNTVRVMVRDNADEVPIPAGDHPDPERLGLTWRSLLNGLTHSYGVIRHGPGRGKTVWFEIRRSSSP